MCVSCTVSLTVTGITLWQVYVNMCKYACKMLTGCLCPRYSLCNGEKFYFTSAGILTHSFFAVIHMRQKTAVGSLTSLAKGLVNCNPFEDKLLVYLFVAFFHADCSGV